MRNKKHQPIPLLVTLAFALHACSGCSPTEKVYRNMYNGLQNREQMLNPNDDHLPRENSGYDAYKKEREEILKKE
jgi:hypothetical protein